MKQPISAILTTLLLPWVIAGEEQICLKDNTYNFFINITALGCGNGNFYDFNSHQTTSDIVCMPAPSVLSSTLTLSDNCPDIPFAKTYRACFNGMNNPSYIIGLFNQTNTTDTQVNQYLNNLNYWCDHVHTEAAIASGIIIVALVALAIFNYRLVNQGQMSSTSSSDAPQEDDGLYDSDDVHESDVHDSDEDSSHKNGCGYNQFWALTSLGIPAVIIGILNIYTLRSLTEPDSPEALMYKYKVSRNEQITAVILSYILGFIEPIFFHAYEFRIQKSHNVNDPSISYGYFYLATVICMIGSCIHSIGMAITSNDTERGMTSIMTSITLILASSAFFIMHHCKANRDTRMNGSRSPHHDAQELSVSRSDQPTESTRLTDDQPDSTRDATQYRSLLMGTPTARKA